MCYLCLQNNPFSIPSDVSKTINKKERAAEIKMLLKELESDTVCENGNKEVELLKEEQYKLSREI